LTVDDTIDETSPLTSGLDLLLAPIMPTEQTDSSSIDSSGPSPVIPVEPDSQSIQVDKISISGRERRPNISRRCRRRIFALWEEFKTLFPIKEGCWVLHRCKNQFRVSVRIVES